VNGKGKAIVCRSEESAFHKKGARSYQQQKGFPRSAKYKRELEESEGIQNETLSPRPKKDEEKKQEERRSILQVDKNFGGGQNPIPPGGGGGGGLKGRVIGAAGQNDSKENQTRKKERGNCCNVKNKFQRHTGKKFLKSPSACNFIKLGQPHDR